MRILITDGENRSALAATRSLGRSGHLVYVTAQQEESLASCSRYCSGGFAAPDPFRQSDEYAPSILDLTDQQGIDAIFPMTEQSIYLLNAARGRLPENCMLACSGQDIMQKVSNKYDLFRMAEKIRVPIPRTYYMTDAGDLHSQIDAIADYPVVVKPALSRIKVANGFLTGGVKYAFSREELEHMYANSEVLQYPSLIQEKIIGPGTGLFTLYDHEGHRALFSHQRLREKPPSGGVSVVSQSVALDEEMVDSADKLLSAVGFCGVAMVEFKRDIRDGKAKLMEINGRFWGTLQLAVTCGIDFPALYADYLCGIKPDYPLREYQTGHQMKWFFGTLDHLFLRFKKRPGFRVPDSGPSRVRALMDFLRIFESNTSYDVFRTNDLKPFLHEAKCYVQAIRRKND